MSLVSSFRRLVAVSHKELLYIQRDPRVIYLALGLPVVLLALFGYAVSFDLDRLPLVLVDQDRTRWSRELAQAMEASGAFRVTARLGDPGLVERHFRRAEVKAAIVIGPGFGRKLERGEPAQAQLLLDGAEGVTANLALGYALGLSQAHTRELIRQQQLGVEPPLIDRTRVLYNPGLRSARFIVPGLSAVIVAIMAVLLTALTVSREWERGSMEQLFVTPLRRSELILGKLLPYLGIGLTQVLLVLSVGAWLFGVPLSGSLWVLFGGALLFLVGMLGQGLLISVVTRNQQVATQVGVLSSLLPTLLLSGFLFPVENMPRLLQLISALIPGRYFILILRGVLLKGSGLDVLGSSFVALGLFALAMLVLSTARFARRLD